MQLRQTVAQALQRAQLPASAPIIVAVSTGVDSMVLLDLLQQVVAPRTLVVAHVNHQLRAASQAEAQFLQRYCDQHQLRLVIRRWEHPQLTHGMEAQARTFRYRFFAELMQQYHAAALITAHHQNDQAETVLMRLARSEDVGAATGIQPTRPFAGGQLLRPLLSVSKATLRAYADQHQLQWCEDQTNQRDDVTRNRIRHAVIPQLERENDQAVPHLANFAKNLQHFVAQYHTLATRLIDERRLTTGPTWIEYQLSPADQAVLEPLIRVLAERGAVPEPLTTGQLTQIVHLMQNHQRPQGEINVGQGWQFVKRYQRIRWQKKAPNPKESSQRPRLFMVVLNHWYRLPHHLMFGVFTPDYPVGPVTRLHRLWLPTTAFPLEVRPWQATDRLRLQENQHQRVRRILINHKVPSEERAHYYTLQTATGEALALLGLKESVQSAQAGRQPYMLAVKNERKNDERRYPNSTV
ncbi:tRNA lysidine(34) synthetase TilS [Fructilactobacillus ixorae]|uniref:tRNA(Ile)-lysidine synthase n=1 Tax=Fructilactobacillus ixorae TaxID=1750535 RepID=A0ABY5C608_9LACO|nr:tRNA lysidine(34) synthetase TilS [Fructilactobacillus ixorae]USS93555.1 tRNA lysidine(34) synthetase TilS [Fructilactobacillus ixorae]